MKYIDKQKPEYKEKGHQISKQFVDGQWQEESGKYVNLNYKAFRNDEMCQLTMKEQHGYCCYCMRELTESNITLEHVIPNKTKDTHKFSKYIAYGALGSENVFLWDKEQSHIKLSVPPYPHFVAYENLVASCNGVLIENGKEQIILHQCCNNRRGQEFIIPLFFLENVSELITYENDGDMTYDDEYDNTINNVLNLKHQTLTLFRRAWANISHSYSVDDVKSAKSEKNLRDDILDDSTLQTNDKITLNKEIYWKLFSEFSWFHQYYTNKTA